MAKRVMALVVCVALVWCAGQAFAAGSLKDMVNAGKTIKVFMKEVVPAQGEDDVNAPALQAELTKAFEGRKSVNFDIVTDPSTADVQVAVTGVTFQYLEKGPMKFSPSPSTMALDAMATMQYNYVEAAGLFTVTDAKTGAVLWSDTTSTYVKKAMTPQESVGIAFDKLARGFVAKAFGKPTT